MPGRRPVAALLALAGWLASAPADAQDWFLLQGIVDAELFETDTGSPLLTRNEGDTAALGRLQLWTAFQLSPSLQLYAQGQAEASNYEGYGETGSDLDQLAIRYTRQSAPWLYFEAGKILSPLAAYSERRLSTRNPLIGQPYLYTRAYPWGAKIVGSADWFDYQLAWVDPSRSDGDYQVIEPDPAFRPVLSAGVTPFTGLRFGLSWTRGPYLNREVENHLPAGSRWRDFDQDVVGLDFQFSRGYLEFNGQLLRTGHEVPGHEADPEDLSYFLELKYTWTPRLYGALRYHDVELSYVDYPAYGYWRTEARKFRALEVGIGYRFNPELLLKVVYQADDWEGYGYGYGYYGNPGGRALGMQLSWSFDLLSLLEDPR